MTCQVVPDGDQAAGVEDTGWYRAGQQRKTADISRTQYEAYSFSTKHNHSEAAVSWPSYQLLQVVNEVSLQTPQATVTVTVTPAHRLEFSIAFKS